SSRFGHPPGVYVGDTFESKRQLHDAGVHAGLRSGIHGQKDVGAFSIVMAGGYEDDIDYGDKIYFVGTGGQETVYGGPQKCDQSFEHSMNQALLKSMETQQPVRVIRGWELRSAYAPKEGFRYDGLYRVKSAEMKKGRSGFQVCVFKLRRIRDQPALPPARLVSERTPKMREKRPRDKDDEAYKPPSRSTSDRSERCRAERRPKRRVVNLADGEDEDDW
ncbi:hypothetical protein BV20DRAFT_954158, partial [Pilatotrama ljubarskyi]